jgi:UDP-2-acetamido-3-amino-2,3-dideoxy-glucuronate N-acetyltransferase
MKLCVIGAGRWGKNHIKTLHSLGVLAAIVEANKETLAQFQKQYPEVKTYSDFMAKGVLDYDAYSVVVPAEHHFKVAKYLLENDKHVLVEKPITLNSKDALELTTIAKNRKKILMTGHVMLFHPAICKIKELINEGKIGKLQYIYSNRLNLGTVRKEENSLWNFAPHDISIFQYLLEDTPKKIISSGGAFLQPSIHDTTMTMLHYPRNVICHIFVSWLHPFKEFRLVVIGSKGMFSYEDSSPEKHLYFYEKGIDWIHGEPIKREGPREGPTEIIEYEKAMPLTNELQHFIHCIEGKETNTLINGEKGLEVLEILEQAQSSLEQDGEKLVPEFKKEVEKKNHFVHPLAVVDDNVQIGDGTKIWHFTHVQKNSEIGKKCILGQNVNIANNVKIGNYCKIQNNVAIYEGVEIEDYVFCGPSMVFTNINNPRSKYPQVGAQYYLKTLVKEGASIGANATIVCGHTLGRFCFIGAGTVVTKDVPDFAMVVGNPGRIIGWMSEAGTKLKFNKDNIASCEKSNKRYILERGLVKELA